MGSVNIWVFLCIKNADDPSQPPPPPDFYNWILGIDSFMTGINKILLMKPRSLTYSLNRMNFGQIPVSDM